MHYFLTEACYAKIAGLKNIGKNMQVISVTNSQRKAWNKQTIIFLSDVALFFILLNTLPFALLRIKDYLYSHFVAILWLTEAVSVTITALFVPILSVLLGLADSREALVAFADPTIFLFFGGFCTCNSIKCAKDRPNDR